MTRLILIPHAGEWQLARTSGQFTRATPILRHCEARSNLPLVPSSHSLWHNPRGTHVFELGAWDQFVANRLAHVLTLRSWDHIHLIGSCGALVPILKTGDVICDPSIVYTSPSPLFTPEQKRIAHTQTGAHVVDMETTHVLTVCHDADLTNTNIRVTRVVWDELEDTLDEHSYKHGCMFEKLSRVNQVIATLISDWKSL